MASLILIAGLALVGPAVLPALGGIFGLGTASADDGSSAPGSTGGMSSSSSMSGSDGGMSSGMSSSDGGMSGSDGGMSSGVSSDSGFSSNDSGFSGYSADSSFSGGESAVTTDSSSSESSAMGAETSAPGTDSSFSDTGFGIASTDSVATGFDSSFSDVSVTGTTTRGITSIASDTSDVAGLATTPGPTSTDTGYSDTVSGPTGFEGSPEVGPAHAAAVSADADPGGAYAGSETGFTGFEGSPEVGPAHAAAVTSDTTTESGLTGFEGSPEVGPDHAAAMIGPYAGSPTGFTGFEGSPEIGPDRAAAMIGPYAGAESGFTGFEGSPEIGPEHAAAVRGPYAGSESGFTGFEGSPEVGPDHAIQVSEEQGWNVAPKQWEYAIGITHPFFGVPTYNEGTIAWGPGWTDFQTSYFVGPGVGAKKEVSVRDSPRTPGLVAETKATATYGVVKGELGFQTDFQDETVPGTVKFTVGPYAKTGRFDVAPTPAWHGWDRTSFTKPTGVAGLGFSAATGARYSSDVVNFADVVSGLVNDITSYFSGPPAPTTPPSPTSYPSLPPAP